jgi:hypothetical protein
MRFFLRLFLILALLSILPLSLEAKVSPPIPEPVAAKGLT